MRSLIFAGLFATSGLALPSLTSRDYRSWSIQADTPTSTNASATFQDGDSKGNWYDIDSDISGEIFQDGDGPLPYRVKGDPASAIVLAIDWSIDPVSYHVTNGSTTVDVNSNIHTTYNASASVNSTLAGQTVPIYASQGMYVDNAGCDSSINITATTTHWNGTNTTITGVDHVGVPIDATVHTVSLVANGSGFDNVLTVLTYSNSTPYTVQYGTPSFRL